MIYQMLKIGCGFTVFLSNALKGKVAYFLANQKQPQVLLAGPCLFFLDETAVSAMAGVGVVDVFLVLYQRSTIIDLAVALENRAPEGIDIVAGRRIGATIA
jgi:hypothetical protein